MRFAAMGLLALMAACGGEEAKETRADSRAKPVVYTTFYPTTYFAERIAGDLAEVVCPLPDGEDPIFWDPGEEAIRGYQEADLIVINGASFEKWVDKVSLPMARMVDTAKGFSEEFVRYEESTTHSHGKTGEHSHEGIDGHTWLDPVLATTQAEAIHRGLVRLLPDQEDQLDARLETLKADLAQLDAALAETKGLTIYASHPAYNYVARRYGWNVVNLDLDPAAMPADEVFAEVKAKGHANTLLWESEPVPEIAKRFEEESGLKSIVFSPCEGAPESGDFLAAMKANLERIR